VVGPKESYMTDLREKLSRVTVKNGASPNEEAIARRKIAEYAKFMNKTRPQPRVVVNEPMPIHEQMFLKEWFALKMANRKKWKVL
jgi:hypothetical protein